ncbi:MAG: NRDE family protein [Bryobacteraceae bacterium]|nr:NRDE family protein [Bryobacteraceae bacterium]
MSWIHEPGGYQMLCNRDEKLTRLPASAPVVETRDGVRFIAPRDGDFGGTWMSVNELGVSLCLLNGPGSVPAGARSRGTIVMNVAASKSASAAIDQAAEGNLGAFAPFQLLAVDLHGRACLLAWDGSNAEVIADAAAQMPLTSSSFDTAQVCARRRDTFRRRRVRSGSLTPEFLLDFHRSHEKHPDAYSVCMHRDDAATVSFSWVTVRDTDASYLYSPAAPCQGAASEVVRLGISK